MTGARKRSMILPRIVQGRAVRWPGAGVVSRRVPIDIGAQHTERDSEKREPKVGKTLIRISIPKDNFLPSKEPIEAEARLHMSFLRCVPLRAWLVDDLTFPPCSWISI